MTELLIILALILANGFFAGAEIAVIALRRNRIEELAQEGKKSASAVLALRDQPERFLATVQVGITVVGATAAAFGGASIAAKIAPIFAKVSWIGGSADALALALVIAAISYLSIVLGELIPKSLALRGAERFSLVVARPLLWLSWLARPIVWLLSSSANLLLKPFGDHTTFSEARYSAEELQHLVEEAGKSGMIHPDAGEIASRALDLPDLTAADVMIPRQEVVMIPHDASEEALRETLLTHPHSRMPVYQDRVDNIVGYLGIKDLLARAVRNEPFVLSELIRPAYFVPETMTAMALLADMRRRRVFFAIVVDEQGGTSGIVTMEDLVEELTGEIFSEYVAHVPKLIREEPDGSALVSGAAPIREINRALDIELPEEGDWTTLAGLCLALAGKIPSAGEVLQLPDGLSLEIVEASARRVRTVRVRRPPPPA